MPRTSILQSLSAAFLLGTFAFPAFGSQMQSSPTTSATGAEAQKPKASPHKSSYGSEGERVFAQNCSRCHTAPDGFSPHISGTVVLHMRVRASLSQHDEQELLRFFNP